VRAVITRLVSRVGKLKHELEEILDDDKDMLNLHLETQQFATAPPTRATSLMADRPTVSPLRDEPPPPAASAPGSPEHRPLPQVSCVLGAGQGTGCA